MNNKQRSTPLPPLPRQLNPFFKFDEPLDLSGDGNRVIGVYNDGCISQPLLCTQIRAMNLFSAPGADPYTLVLKQDENYMDSLLRHLVFQEWRPFLEPIFNKHRDAIQKVLNQTPYCPFVHMILNSFNLVHPESVRYIIVGMRPRAAEPPRGSTGLSLVHVPAPIQLRAGAANVQTRRPWEEIFANMFESGAMGMSDDSNAIDTTLSFLLRQGDVLLVNLLLTTPMHSKVEELHFTTWLRVMPQILSNFVKARTAKGAKCTTIALGRTAYGILCSHDLTDLYWMQNPTQLGLLKIKDSVIQTTIGHVLDVTGLRAHLAQQSLKHEQATTLK